MQDVHMISNPGFHDKSSIQREEGSFHQQIGLKLQELTGEVLRP
jgi:hypothetical protein